MSSVALTLTYPQKAAMCPSTNTSPVQRVHLGSHYHEHEIPPLSPPPPLVLHVAVSVLTCFIQIGQQLITRYNNRKVNKNAHERRGT